LRDTLKAGVVSQEIKLGLGLKRIDPGKDASAFFKRPIKNFKVYFTFKHRFKNELDFLIENNFTKFH